MIHVFKGSRSGKASRQNSVPKGLGEHHPGSQVRRRQCHAHLGRKRRQRIQGSNTRPGMRLGCKLRPGCLDPESGERNTRTVHRKTPRGITYGQSAPLRKGERPELQGNVAAAVPQRIDHQIQPRQFEGFGIKTRDGTMSRRFAGHPVVPQRDPGHPDLPRHGSRGGFYGNRCRRFRLGGRTGSHPAEVCTPVQFQTGHRNPRSGKIDVAPLHRSLHKRRFQRHPFGSCPHPECGIRHRETSDRDAPRQRRRIVLRGGCRGRFETEIHISSGQIGPKERKTPFPEINPTDPQRQAAHRCTDPHSGKRIGITEAEIRQIQHAYGHFAPQQRQRSNRRLQAAAAKQRIPLFKQHHPIDRQMQRKGQTDTADGEIHTE